MKRYLIVVDLGFTVPPEGVRVDLGGSAAMTTPPATSPSSPVRVVLVDDQQMVRAGFRMVIDSQPDLTVVGEAGDGAAAVELLRRTAADVVLMDIRMPGTDGIEATRQVTALPDPPRVVVLTTFDLDEYVVAAIGAGASGFLLKDAAPEEMLAAPADSNIATPRLRRRA